MNTTPQSNLFKRQFSLCHQTKFGCKRISRGSLVLKILSRETFINILKSTVTLALNTETPFFFSNDTPAYKNVLSNQVWLQKVQQFRRYRRNSRILITQALDVTMTLTLQRIIYHHSKLGFKRLNGLGDIVWTNIHWDLKPSMWLWPCTQQYIFHRPLQPTMMCDQTKFGRKQIKSIEGKVETVIFWLYKPSLWPWPLT